MVKYKTKDTEIEAVKLDEDNIQDQLRELVGIDGYNFDDHNNYYLIGKWGNKDVCPSDYLIKTKDEILVIAEEHFEKVFEKVIK